MSKQHILHQRRALARGETATPTHGMHWRADVEVVTEVGQTRNYTLYFASKPVTKQVRLHLPADARKCPFDFSVTRI